MKQPVEKTFGAMFALEELRQIWRDTAPQHKLSDEQLARAQELLEQIRGDVDSISKTLGGLEK